MEEFIYSGTEFVNITLKFNNEQDDFDVVNSSSLVRVLGSFILPYTAQAPHEYFRFNYEEIEFEVDSNIRSNYYCGVNSLDEQSRWAFFENSTNRPLFLLEKNMIFTLKKIGFNINLIEPEITDEYQDYNQISEILSGNNQNLYICSVVERLIFNRNHVHDSTPFIFIDGSSGMGKTQTALTLVKTYSMESADIPGNHLFRAFHRPQRRVLYFTFLTTSTIETDISILQEIYKTYSPRSSLFRECLDKDIAIEKLSIQSCTANILSRKSLYIFGFIVQMLNESIFPDQDLTHEFVVPRITVVEASNFIRDHLGGVKPIVILDEYTVVGSQEIFARFARNALRALDIGVIVTGTDSKAVNLIDYVNPLSRRSSPPMFTPWCYVIGDLPPTDIEACNITPSFPDILLRIIQISRPWFAQLIVKKYQLLLETDMEFQNLPLNEIFNKLISLVSAEIYRVKDVFNNVDGRLGQSRLFLGASYIPNSKLLIHKHFAKIHGPPNFCITLDGKRCEIERKQFIESSYVWNPTACFPTLSEDCLLFILLSGYSIPAFAEIQCGSLIPVEFTYRYFFNSLENSSSTKRNKQEISNPRQRVNSGIALESLCSVAMIVASHFSGVQGTKFSDFLRICMYHLSFWETLKSELFPAINFPDEISEFSKYIVPFLSPPCQAWPVFLTENRENYPILFGNFERSKNFDRIDLSIINYSLTGEVKDWNDSIPIIEMAKILNNIKRTSRIHLVFVNQLQISYFRHTQLTLSQYLIEKYNTSAAQLEFIETSCAFFRVRIPSEPLNLNLSNSSLPSLVCRQVTGLPTIPNNPMCLILFVEIAFELDNDDDLDMQRTTRRERLLSKIKL